MIAEAVALAQAEKPIIDFGAMDISIKASTKKAFAVKPTLEAATQEAITVSNPEAHLVTSEMRQLLTQLTPGETSAQPSAPESTPMIVIETDLEVLLR